MTTPNFSNGATPENADIVDQVLGPDPEGDARADDDDADDDAAPPPEQRQVAKPEFRGQPPRQGSKWKAKKTERGRLIGELTRRAEDAERRQREDSDRFGRQLEEMRREIAAGRQTPSNDNRGGGQGQPDPITAELKSVQGGIAAELKLMQQHDPARGDYDMTRYNELQDRRSELIAQRAALKLLMERGGQQRHQGEKPMTPQERRNMQRYDTLASEFEWLEDKQHPEWSRAAGAYKRFLIEVEKRPDTIETDREACTEIAAREGLGVRRASPSQADRARAAGMGGRGYAGGGGARRRAPAPQDTEGFDPRMLQGTGLSRDKLKRIVAPEDDE